MNTTARRTVQIKPVTTDKAKWTDYCSKGARALCVCGAKCTIVCKKCKTPISCSGRCTPFAEHKPLCGPFLNIGAGENTVEPSRAPNSLIEMYDALATSEPEERIFYPKVLEMLAPSPVMAFTGWHEVYFDLGTNRCSYTALAATASVKGLWPVHGFMIFPNATAYECRAHVMLRDALGMLYNPKAKDDDTDVMRFFVPSMWLTYYLSSDQGMPENLVAFFGNKPGDKETLHDIRLLAYNVSYATSLRAIEEPLMSSILTPWSVPGYYGTTIAVLLQLAKKRLKMVLILRAARFCHEQQLAMSPDRRDYVNLIMGAFYKALSTGDYFPITLPYDHVTAKMLVQGLMMSVKKPLSEEELITCAVVNLVGTPIGSAVIMTSLLFTYRMANLGLLTERVQAINALALNSTLRTLHTIAPPPSVRSNEGVCKLTKFDMLQALSAYMSGAHSKLTVRLTSADIARMREEVEHLKVKTAETKRADMQRAMAGAFGLDVQNMLVHYVD